MHSSSLSKPEFGVHVCYAVVANEALPSSEFLFIYCVVGFFCFLVFLFFLDECTFKI